MKARFKRFFCAHSSIEIVTYMVTPFQIIWTERCKGCGHTHDELRGLSPYVEAKQYTPLFMGHTGRINGK
jgi:hypothetical protein